MSSIKLADSLRLAPTLSGLGLLIALLLSLPWLPLGAPAQPTFAAYPLGPSSRPGANQSSPQPQLAYTLSGTSATVDDEFTLHVVATEPELRALRARFPNDVTDVIVAIRPDDRVALANFRAALAEPGVIGAPPSVKIRDYRCDPMPPTPRLCPLPPAHD